MKIMHSKKCSLPCNKLQQALQHVDLWAFFQCKHETCKRTGKNLLTVLWREVTDDTMIAGYQQQTSRSFYTANSKKGGAGGQLLVTK